MKKKILFVDDSKTVLSSLENILVDQKDEWDMTFASSPQKALRLLNKEPFDVAVLDVYMPGMTGLELLEMLKSHDKTKDIEIIILTSSEEEDLKRHAVDLGATDLLNKPANKADLIARINSAVRLRSYHNELKAQNAELERQLFQSQKMELIGILAAGAVHDLNNLFQSISGYSELLGLNIQNVEKSQRFVKNLKTSADRASEILQQIHRFTRRDKAVQSKCAIGGLITECIELLKPTTPKGITINWTAPEEDFILHADSTQIYQIVMNLGINAIHAMGKQGELTFQTKVINSSEIQDIIKQTEALSVEYVKLSVTDTGCGMNEETIAKIYDPLFTTKRETGGSGLGLAVVNRIIKNNHATIQVSSDLGVGTTFNVYFPFYQEYQ